MDNNSLIDALHASGRHPELGDDLRLFGQFVGDWDVDVTTIGPDGSTTQKGEWHFGWALEGRAVVDVFVVPRRSLRDGQSDGAYGITVRIFDPSIHAWRSTWIGPTKSVVYPFIARQMGNEIVLEGTFTEGTLDRWIFSDVTATSFRWRAMQSIDGGSTWTAWQEMDARRVSS